jgi:hypothetical protein
VYVTRRTGADGFWQTPLRVSGAETTGTGIGASHLIDGVIGRPGSS